MAAIDYNRASQTAGFAGNSVAQFSLAPFAAVAAWNDKRAANLTVRPTFRPFAALSAWKNARATYKALSGLTAQQLDDIGVIPGDIKKIAGHR